MLLYVWSTTPRATHIRQWQKNLQVHSISANQGAINFCGSSTYMNFLISYLLQLLLVTFVSQVNWIWKQWSPMKYISINLSTELCSFLCWLNNNGCNEWIHPWVVITLRLLGTWLKYSQMGIVTDLKQKLKYKCSVLCAKTFDVLG